MEVKIKKLSENAVIPTRGSEQAAGLDLYALDDERLAYPININPHETVMVHTGISIAIPNGFFGGVYPRSGLASKKGLRPANCVGVIDSDYRGEVMVALHNDSDKPKTIMPGDRIAQLIIQPYEVAVFNKVDDLDDTDRGSGGFGHTGA